MYLDLMRYSHYEYSPYSPFYEFELNLPTFRRLNSDDLLYVEHYSRKHTLIAKRKIRETYGRTIGFISDKNTRIQSIKSMNSSDFKSKSISENEITDQLSKVLTSLGYRHNFGGNRDWVEIVIENAQIEHNICIHLSDDSLEFEVLVTFEEIGWDYETFPRQLFNQIKDALNDLNSQKRLCTFYLSNTMDVVVCRFNFLNETFIQSETVLQRILHRISQEVFELTEIIDEKIMDF